jgi:hypothetical protein
LYQVPFCTESLKLVRNTSPDPGWL